MRHYNKGDIVPLDKEKRGPLDYCPVCGERYSLRAKDLECTSFCNNGHKWHFDALGDRSVIVDID